MVLVDLYIITIITVIKNDKFNMMKASSKKVFPKP